MINFRRVVNILGLLVIIEGFFLSVCIPVAAWYGDGDLNSFLVTAIIMFAGGSALWSVTRKADNRIGKREGFIIVSLVWVVFSFLVRFHSGSVAAYLPLLTPSSRQFPDLQPLVRRS